MYDDSINKFSQGEADVFRRLFKYYKRRCPPPDFSHVVDVREESFRGNNSIEELHLSNQLDNADVCELGIRPVPEWKVFKFTRHPGFMIISDVFTSNGAEFWINQCFEKYPRHPNPTNVKEKIDMTTNDDFILNKLHWTTLGYHYDWNSKVYSEDNRGEFPSNLSKLSKVISEYVGYKNFTPEAAIVNYYNMDSTLGGHTDHSEKNCQAPLFSFSFGQSAIFMLGGTTKSAEPTAMLLRHGDIAVMSSESRLCYHGVPRIVPNTDLNISGRWSWLISRMRLNINVRQVN